MFIFCFGTEFAVSNSKNKRFPEGLENMYSFNPDQIEDRISIKSLYKMRFFYLDSIEIDLKKKILLSKYYPDFIQMFEKNFIQGLS